MFFGCVYFLFLVVLTILDYSCLTFDLICFKGKMLMSLNRTVWSKILQLAL